MKQNSKPEGRELKKYIAGNLDRAISEGWIKVFYQPVVRTLTGDVCGMEALSRWDDPDFGMLSPLDFIGTLEKARLIHRLDSYVIQRICSDYARLRTEGKAYSCTVSFNLSRLDFSLCDIHAVIEDAIKKNKVPREALRVEITESTMENDSRLMHDVIDRFWERGLRVWMDDFGSGYSSLNVLKDYHFDTLKIDMVFLKSYDPRSREIIRSVVNMAKRLGVHTLAEGVENAEQLEFLKNIGCEKAQGYYIGKPLPYEECIKWIHDRGLMIESAGKRQYYHDIGRVNLLSATPLDFVMDNEKNLMEQTGQVPIAIIEMSGEKEDLKYLFANEAYRRVNLEIGLGTIEEIEKEYSDGVTDAKNKFVSLLNRAKETGEIVMTDFIKNSHYCYSRVRFIAEYSGGCAFLVVLQDMFHDESSVKSNRLSDALMSICEIYDNIVEVDLNTGYSVGAFHSMVTKTEYHKRLAEEELRQYANEEIYPEDRAGYIEFTDLSTIEERLDRASVPHLSEPFRTRTSSKGSYTWMLYSFMRVGKPADRKVLACMRRLPDATIARLYGDRGLMGSVQKSGADGDTIRPEVLWKNFVYNSDTAFFWKDVNRKFLGANRKFLDYFGFDSADVLRGRNDEEMGWHIDIEPYKSDEERILEKGEETFLVPGKVICNGAIHNIVASKYPIYNNGEIIGLMGYFLDVTDWSSQMRNKAMNGWSKDDRETMYFMGMMEYALQYQSAYRQYHQDFAMVILSVTNLELYRADFGNEMCDALNNAIACRIQEAVGNVGVTGRAGSEYFLVLRQMHDGAEMDDIISKIIAAGEAITSVNGISCTPYLKAGYGFYSEAGNFQALYMLAIKRLRENK